MESSTNFNKMCESIFSANQTDAKAKITSIKTEALLYESILLVNSVVIEAKIEAIKKITLLYRDLLLKSFYSAYRVNDDDEKSMFTVHAWADMQKNGSESETPIFHVLINSKQGRGKRGKIKTLGVDTTDDEIELVYMAMRPQIKKLQEFFQ